MNARNGHLPRAGRPGKVLLAGIVWVLILAAKGGAWAQVPGTPGQATAQAVVNVAELARQQAATPPAPPQRRVIPFMSVPPRRSVPPEGVRPQKPTPPSAEMGLPAAAVPSPSPAASFAALGDNDLAIPPDTMGAAGPNHLMVTLNTEVRIQNRTGGTISTVSLDSFWSGVCVACVVFDPKLTYDPFNNRWIFAAVSNGQTASSSVLIGVSRTSDPTGIWNLFRVDADSGNTKWADYPSLGFNKDWIVVGVNMFANSNNDYLGPKLYVFRKALLYANTGSTHTVLTPPAAAFTQAPAVTYDNTLSTMYLVEHFNGDFGGGIGQLIVSTITGPVGSEVYTDGVFFVTATSTWGFAPTAMADFAPQLGSLQKIQNGDARILNAVYRNGSLWATQNAFLPSTAPTRTAAQWWQFQTNGTLQQFGRVDDSSGSVFYAYPSIAVNSQNDVLLGFSSFSATQYASAGYAFRLAGDTSGTMRTPAMLQAGTGSYYKIFSGARNRWGDYSGTVVDPVNDLDFWTIQEYASSPDFPNGDDRWGTWWGKVSPPLAKRRGQLVSD
ncbi:MAG: hypothetical protein HY316_10155 [Acidobacteria bacterium]|nr:hypothetical protein [Acidobacteriota bacterium]